ncbi:MAG: hypothetical protein E7Z77_07215 [Methanobrevibacter sp.]|uniref:hypothetical protein n=1 Tax=Methanobrevibacter sp. TaxID=66852 RepID=UPI0025E6BA08|nr:hypothetical protein [Methanobrevibacter sp.]MBE6509185.1 hypothetical protein [Methanobrevibacter sp.]
MLENRPRGRQLAKRIGYVYLIIAILMIVFLFVIPPYAELIGINFAFYLIMFLVLYYITTKYENDSVAWIIIAIIGFLVMIWTFNLLGVLLFIFSLVAANDIRKELN